MGLQAVLVDRARRIANSPTGRKVDGSTVFDRVAGPWFPARLTMPPAYKRHTASQVGQGTWGGPNRAVLIPTLIFKPKLPGGSALVGLDADDWVEVDSPQLGRAVYRLTNEPEPWRRRRRVIGYQASLERVEEHEMEPIR